MTIDELVIELNLDPSGFTEGQKKAVESFKKTEEEIGKQLKNIDAATKNTGYSFGNTMAAAEGLFGALAGAGMAAFARDTMQSVAATGRMAANIGVATDELSAFGRMIERNGGNADAAMGSLKSLSDQVERFKVLGEASQDLQMFSGTVGADLNSSPLAIFMKYAEWANAHRDDLKLVNLIGRMGGFDQGAINEALKGSVQVLKDYQAAQKGAIDPSQVQAMIRMQDAWVTLDQAIEKTGRDIVVSAEPAITGITKSIAGWIQGNQNLADTLGKVLATLAALSAIKPAWWLLRMLGVATPTGAAVGASAVAAEGITKFILSPETARYYDEKYPTLGNITKFFGMEDYYSKPGETTSSAQSGSGGRDPAAVREKRIRSLAAILNIDPDIAMFVARKEGFNDFSGDHGTSFGDFQLHLTRGHRGRAVGDQFQIDTGLDPRDPKNEAAADEYFLRFVKKNGWDPNGGGSHGATNAGIGNWQGIQHTGDVNVTINTDTKSPRDHGNIAASEIHKAWSSKITTQANTGLNN